MWGQNHQSAQNLATKTRWAHHVNVRQQHKLLDHAARGELLVLGHGQSLPSVHVQLDLHLSGRQLQGTWQRTRDAGFS